MGAVIAALMQAIRVRNADALGALCSPDVACYDMTPQQGSSAAEGVRAHWAETWEAFEGRIGCDATQLHITLGADVAFGRSLLRLSGMQSDGVRRTQWVCATFGLRRNEGVWRFVHQHYSQPFERAPAPAAPAVDPATLAAPIGAG